MRCLVTGAHGFIGTHLSEELMRHGHSVIQLDRPHDLLNPGTIYDAIDRTDPDRVIHLAAKVGRVFGEDGLMDTIASNAAMSANIAKACGEIGIPLVYASSSEVYGDLGETLAEEDVNPVLPHNIYGLSKRWGEEACQLYAPGGLLIWRISMPYGPGLPAGRGRAAIINFLDQALQRVPIPVHRGAERSWCWIGDTVRAMRLTLERGSEGVYNIGRDDDARPMAEVAEIACALTGCPTRLIEFVEAPNNQTVVKRLGTGKIRALGWEPQVSLEEGMGRTLAVLLKA